VRDKKSTKGVRFSRVCDFAYLRLRGSFENSAFFTPSTVGMRSRTGRTARLLAGLSESRCRT